MAGRILIYSHDSFGLGHLRRCLAIARALTERIEGASALIVSGSPAIGRFDFPPRVDFVRVPGIIKQSDGDYVAEDGSAALDETLEMRARLILETARAYSPDLFLVDKEPLGLRGEVAAALHDLKARGARLVVGFRDVLDEPSALAAEWRRKGAHRALDELYDELWVFGLADFFQPLEGTGASESTLAKLVYTGYLRRGSPIPKEARMGPILVTPGGGGDGEALVDAVIRAYEAEGASLPEAEILFGPFMAAAARDGFSRRARATGRIATQSFTPHPEEKLRRARGVVAMGGYNTFSEILSFDLPALLIPRERPRREQRLRAERADALKLARFLQPEAAKDPRRLAALIRDLERQPPPSAAAPPCLLDGLDAIVERARPWLDGRRA